MLKVTKTATSLDTYHLQKELKQQCQCQGAGTCVLCRTSVQLSHLENELIRAKADAKVTQQDLGAERAWKPEEHGYVSTPTPEIPR